MTHGRRSASLLLMVVPLFCVLGWAGSCPSPASSQSPVAEKVPASSDLTPTPGVYQVHFGNQDRLAELAAQFDIWEVESKAGYALVPLGAKDVEHLRSEGYGLELDRKQTQKWVIGPPGYLCYRDVDGLYADLKQMSTSYPHLVDLIDYGDSWRKVQGLSSYDLWVLKLTNDRIQGPKPRLFLMANIHGRELTTPETAMYFAEYLLENYGTDPDSTWILDYHEIYVVVTANPDGRELAEDGCYQRKNRNDTLGDCIFCASLGFNNQYGVDLNRNFSYNWGGASANPCRETYQGTSAESEPETYYLSDLVRSIFPDQRPGDSITPAPNDATGLLISLHSYGNLVLWPWGWTYASAPNQIPLQSLGRKFAYFDHYTPQQASDLYPTTGDTVDWAYGELGVPAYTFELGRSFFEDCANLQQIMQENLGALLYAAKVPRTPYVTPAGPDAVWVSALPNEVITGNPVQLTATIDDTRYESSDGSEPVQGIAAAAFYIDTPPWITATAPVTHSMAAADGEFDEALEEVQASLDTTGLSEGRHIIFVRGQDANAVWGALSAVFVDIRVGFRTYLPAVANGSPSPKRLPHADPGLDRSQP